MNTNTSQIVKTTIYYVGQRRSYFGLIILIATWFVYSPAIYAQESPEKKTESPPPITALTNDKAAAQLYYRNVDPKQLFPILQETYHVQFEGVDAVEGPITLISKGDQKVDLQGMLLLLDEVLSGQGKITRRQGQIIRIVPRQDIVDKPIELKYADPQKVVSVLTALFLVKENDPPEVKANKAIYIAVHPQKKGVLVRGRKEAIAAIEEYIKTAQLDVDTTVTPQPPTPDQPPQPPLGPLLREFITLQYMDAEEFQKLIQQDQTLTDYTTAVAPNNNLIVFSRNKEVFEKISEMQAAFDIDRMEIRYLPLKNANADAVAKLLNSIYPEQAAAESALPVELQTARRGRGSDLTDEEAYSLEMMTRQALTRAGIIEPQARELLSEAISVLPKGELNIVPDKERNALIIRTFSRNFPRITELIEKLDQPRQQVLIDVFITEVTLDDTTELGVDFTYFHNERTNTLTQAFLGTTQKPTGFGQPAGLTYDLISNNITAFIRALQETNKLDVVSRPQILTKDNTKANISLGRDVPLVDKTTLSIEGAVNSSIKYTKVQTVLTVTPHIHPDDYVTLDISQTIDDVSAETFQISKDFNPQILIRRSATSQVRVKDGQTICMGGFVGDSIIENESRVPLLADIPLLGYLFRYSSQNRVKTELIIFITPHILESPQEMLRMTNEMRRISNSKQLEDRGSDIIDPQRNLRYPPYREPLPEIPEAPDAEPVEMTPEKTTPAPSETTSTPKNKPKPKEKPKPEKKKAPEQAK